MCEHSEYKLFLPAPGARTILQSGANRINNDARLLAPAPSAAAGMAPVMNVTTRSFFVLTAARGSLSRIPNNATNVTNAAVLTLDYIDRQVTWYSGVQCHCHARYLAQAAADLVGNFKCKNLVVLPSRSSGIRKIGLEN